MKRELLVSAVVAAAERERYTSARTHTAKHVKINTHTQTSKTVEVPFMNVYIYTYEHACVYASRKSV